MRNLSVCRTKAGLPLTTPSSNCSNSTVHCTLVYGSLLVNGLIVLANSVIKSCVKKVNDPAGTRPGPPTTRTYPSMEPARSRIVSPLAASSARNSRRGSCCKSASVFTLSPTIRSLPSATSLKSAPPSPSGIRSADNVREPPRRLVKDKFRMFSAPAETDASRPSSRTSTDRPRTVSISTLTLASNDRRNCNGSCVSGITLPSVAGSTCCRSSSGSGRYSDTSNK